MNEEFKTAFRKTDIYESLKYRGMSDEEIFKLNGNSYVYARVEDARIVWQEKDKILIEQGQRFNEQAQRLKDLEHKNSELQNKINAALERSNMACLGIPMFFRQFDDVIAILRGENK